MIDDLKSDDIRKRITSVQNLKSIAEALGATRTRAELLPFLNELMEDEDEVLSALADSLSIKFLSLVGGIEYSHSLFPLLESLSKVEESTIRDKSARTLRDLILQMDVKKNEELLM